jgi:hypothetical protein
MGYGFIVQPLVVKLTVLKALLFLNREKAVDPRRKKLALKP